MREEKYPEIWFNHKWSPICGHHFWDNNYGATLFCRELLNSTYTYGTVTERRDIPLEIDGIRIGHCNYEDTSLFSCTGGCNDLEVGGQCSNSPAGYGQCVAGQGATVEIECFQGT